MKRIGVILVFCILWMSCGIAASRTSVASATPRQGTPTQRVRTQTVTTRKTSRVATGQAQTETRKNNASKGTVASRKQNTKTTAARTATTDTRTGVVARAATSETRTGAEYEQCKTAFFTCMDQFCQLKNDEYRRCSCSDRITKLQSARDKLQEAGEQLTAFNENLDIVSKTAAQATAMNTASEGELALGRDSSASKALLNAILDSIRGSDTTRVENSQLSSLNSIDLSFDSANSFDTDNNGQIIASYNGQALYTAVYPQCRSAVRDRCNSASLQRAVNAYLMAIEQDCNTVQTAITKKQKETHNAIRESSSLLDMARAENHRNHNSDDMATCIANVETAILSEEVCGKNYHKCLDNGEYIDVTTGSPIAGVVDFYKLGKMLTFSTGRSNADQNLAQNPNNQVFVASFEKRVKQFAEPALDKCLDNADTVWTDYLNKALLDIYYAQQDKVNEIKQGCFDFVSACYMNGSTAMTNAMQELSATLQTPLIPNSDKLNKSLCSDYIASCNNMFDGNIVEDYIDNRHDTDSLSACRAVVKQCFDNYGGTNYENFYDPHSGLFSVGYAPSWFALYKLDSAGNHLCNSDGAVHNNDDPDCESHGGVIYVSECAKQIATIDACSNLVEEAFGGLDYYQGKSIYNQYGITNTQGNLQSRLLRPTGVATEIYNQIIDILQSQCTTIKEGKFMPVQNLELYSKDYRIDSFCHAQFFISDSQYYFEGNTTTSSPASDRYYNFFGRSTQTAIRNPNNNSYCVTKEFCDSLNGNWSTNSFTIRPGALSCLNIVTGNTPASQTGACTLTYATVAENMCPADYNNQVDVQSWGACLCWENGGRRSNNGTTPRCVPTFPVKQMPKHYLYVEPETSNGTGSWQMVTNLSGLDNSCYDYYTGDSAPQIDHNTNTYNPPKAMFDLWGTALTTGRFPTQNDWCTGEVNVDGQLCPYGYRLDDHGNCESCPDGYSEDPNTGDCTDGTTSKKTSEQLLKIVPKGK